MLARRGGGRAAVQLDASFNLSAIVLRVRRGRINLRTRHNAKRGKRRLWIGLASKFIAPHHDLPHVGPAHDPSTSPCRAVTKRDQRMLIAARAFLGVAPQPIGQRLSSGTRADTESLSKTVVDSDRHVHVDIVAQCKRLYETCWPAIARTAASGEQNSF